MTYNTEYAMWEFDQHGEIWLQQQMAGQFNTIFDVGSNIGEWTRMARSYHPEAEIHTFEVMPDTYYKIINNIPIDSKIIPNSFGLSDAAGTVDLKYAAHYDAVTTSVLSLRLDNAIIRKGLVFSGDDYVESRDIKQIDYLKIDTEGSEEKVFKGFDKTFEQGKVKMMQFEYNPLCILTKWLLIDSYTFLTQRGFKLGRLRKGNIEFHEYTLFHENFEGPDYVAVHEDWWSKFGL